MAEERLSEARAWLTMVIAPNRPEGEAQQAAFEAAAEAQAAYEAAHGDVLEARRRGMRSFRVGSYSESYGAGGPQALLSPYARALLFNAGLLRRSLPTARRIP